MTGKTTLSRTSPLCFIPCKYNSQIPNTDAKCKPCDRSSTSEDAAACVVIHKTALYGTTSGPDADGTTAKPGDIVTYTLYAQNTGKVDVPKYDGFTENMSDVLDYADITDLHGGTFNSTTKTLTWPAEPIKAGATVTHQITVQVKNPIPSTPPGLTDPQHFDLVMTNVFGNAINIKLPPTTPLVIQTTAAQLPNTGPGSSLLVAAAVVIVAGYFYSRARLLQEESTIAVQEAASA